MDSHKYTRIAEEIVGDITMNAMALHFPSYNPLSPTSWIDLFEEG